jgi:hypothetical protein
VHTRRIATFLLGCWIAGSVFMACVAGYNFRAVGDTLAAPREQVRKSVATLGEEPSRLLLRYHSAEINRALFQYWEDAQFFIAIAFAGSLFFGTEKRTAPLIVGGIMVAILAFQHFSLTPDLIASGREIDFPPGNLIQMLHDHVNLLHRVYVGAEGVKLLAGGVLVSYLFAFRTAKRRRRREDNVVDHAHHSHIDR